MNKLTLDQIAIHHGTDKSTKHHGYTLVYEKFFEKFRDSDILLIECGYGSYHFANQGGHGARTWRDYFKNARIVSTDIYPKTNIPDGVMFYQGSQDDPDFWKLVTTAHGSPEIFIDDASHICSKTVATFKAMFPLMASGGIYVIEDLETNYWRDIASDGQDFEGGLKREGTMVEFLKSLIDDVNSPYSGVPNNFEIESLHIYTKIAFIVKK